MVQNFEKQPEGLHLSLATPPLPSHSCLAPTNVLGLLPKRVLVDNFLHLPKIISTIKVLCTFPRSVYHPIPSHMTTVQHLS